MFNRVQVRALAGPLRRSSSQYLLCNSRIGKCPNNFWSSQITFCKITSGETNKGKNCQCGVTKISITYNMMHYEGGPVFKVVII